MISVFHVVVILFISNCVGLLLCWLFYYLFKKLVKSLGWGHALVVTESLIQLLACDQWQSYMMNLLHDSDTGWVCYMTVIQNDSVTMAVIQDESVTWRGHRMSLLHDSETRWVCWLHDSDTWWASNITVTQDASDMTMTQDKPVAWQWHRMSLLCDSDWHKVSLFHDSDTGWACYMAVIQDEPVTWLKSDSLWDWLRMSTCLCVSIQYDP